MDAFHIALGNLGQKLTLEQEIVAILGAATSPMTSAQILDSMPNPPDRETLSREIFRLASADVITKVGDVPAPPGTPRKTVATYRVATAVAAPATAGKPARAPAGESMLTVVKWLQKNGGGFSSADIANGTGLTPSATWSALAGLTSAGKIERAKAGRGYTYNLVKDMEAAPTGGQAITDPEAPKVPAPVDTSAPHNPPPVAAAPAAPAPFNCAIFADGSLVLRGELQVNDIGDTVLDRAKTATLVNYLRSIDYQGEVTPCAA